ncbi:hypothetical protein FRB94_002270 [Tulasnella sp. JGI-2019a]|nr:hypothetical protein FRB94_002270 [Tulasnella sp. JGI-2019a]
MDHSPPFRRLWAQLRTEVYALQSRGYFGDGYYSSGTRLRDAATIRGQGVGGLGEVLPEYVCGGAHAQKRSGFMQTRRKRKPRREVVPGNQTGAQTAKKRKTGTRMTKPLPGEGAKVSEAGGSKGKRANSNRAREERALAAEKRMLALQGKVEPPAFGLDDNGEDGDDGEDFEPEDDDLRRLAMNEVMSREELEGLRLCDQQDEHDCKEQQKSEPGPSRLLTTSATSLLTPIGSSQGSFASRKRKSVLDGMIHEEVTKRKRESLGMDGPGKKLGTGNKSSGVAKDSDTKPVIEATESLGGCDGCEGHESAQWVCGVCTLENHSDYTRCAACGEKRGFSIDNLP